MHGHTVEISESVLAVRNTSRKQIWNMITFPSPNEMGGTEAFYIGWLIITTKNQKCIADLMWENMLKSENLR